MGDRKRILLLRRGDVEVGIRRHKIIMKLLLVRSHLLRVLQQGHRHRIDPLALPQVPSRSIQILQRILFIVRDPAVTF